MGRFGILVTLMMLACVGTDVLDDSMVGASVIVSEVRVAIMKDEMYQLSALTCPF